MAISPRFDPARLVEAIHKIPSTAWSLPSTYSETGVHHEYRRVVLVSASQWQPYAEHFAFVWDALNPIRDAWLSSLDPGGFIIPHRDRGPWLERWQVPVSTAGEWCANESTFTPINGQAFPVSHWEPHAVVNRSDTPRVHIVVDRNVPIDLPAQPFSTFPIPDSMSDLVKRSQQ